MADTFKKLAQALILTSNTTLYTTPASTTTIIRHMRIVNTNTTTDRTVKLFHNPSGEGGANAADDVILPFVTIDGGGWGEFEGTIILETGDTLVGICGESSTEVTITLYGMEIT